jgi:adenosylcobyric acid synthase
MYEEDVELKYSLDEADINSADLIIIPGSKNTVSDLLFLREYGIENSVKSAVRRGIPLVGVCGGYQMLGQQILDPLGVESGKKEVAGMGLLDTITTLDKTKTTCQISAQLLSKDIFNSPVPELANKGSDEAGFGVATLKGYEIHMGKTSGDTGVFEICRGRSLDALTDGSVKNHVWGTYIHGLFDNDDFRLMLLNSLRKKKGLPSKEATINYLAKKEEAIDNWAGTLKNNVDICFILRQVGMEACLQNMAKDIK